MIDYSRAREKLRAAMLLLATLEGDVQSRLTIAVQEELSMLNKSHLPPEIQEEWQQVWHQLTKLGPTYDHKGGVQRGSVEHTMGRIRNPTAAGIAEQIFHIGWELHTNEKYL